jgi:hypothetical protein
MEGSEECGFLSEVGTIAGRQAMIDSLAHLGQQVAELVRPESARLGLRTAPKLVKKNRREPVIGNGRTFGRCGWLPNRHRQIEIGGF